MRNYWLYGIIVLIVLIATSFEPMSSDVFMFDRQQIDNGQWWRLFSAHFLHLSNTHMLGNVLAVFLFAYISGEYLNNIQGLGLLLWCLLVVGLGLYFFADHLERYVGLSGVLHGLLLVAPFISKYYSHRVAFAFLLAILVKVGWEQSSYYDDMALVDTIGGRVETKAHLLGVIAGLCYLCAWAFFQRRIKGE